MKAKIFIMFNIPFNWDLSNKVSEFFQPDTVETLVHSIWGQSPEKGQKISICSAGITADLEVKSLMDLSDWIVKSRAAFPEIEKVVVFADDAMYHQGFVPAKICLASKICDDGVEIEKEATQLQKASKIAAEKFGDLYIPLFCHDKESKNGEDLLGLMSYATHDHFPNLEKWQQSLMKLLQVSGWRNAAVKNTFVREF